LSGSTAAAGWANYCVAVLGVLFKFGKDHTLVKENPLAENVRRIRTKRQEPPRE